MAMAVPGIRPRGRARGYTPFSKNIDEFQRPGDVPNADELASNNLVKAIEQLSLGHGDGVQMDDIIAQVKASKKKKETMQKAADTLYDKCVENTDFIPTGSKLCSKLAILEVDGVKYFRQLIMGRLQTDFQARETLKKKSSFLNRVRFLCNIFQDMRSPDGSPYKVLVAGICEYLKILISATSTTEDHKLFCSLLLSVGKEIDSVDSEKFDSVIGELRTRIIDTSTNRTHRALLLHSLELAVRKWEPLSADVESYYEDSAR